MSSGYRGGFQDRGSGGRGGRGGGFRGNRGGGGGSQQTTQIFPNPRKPDPKVKSTEDALLPSTGKKSLDIAGLKLRDDLPSRPGYGTKGKQAELTANYVELLPPSNMILHRYDIQMTPEAAGRKCFRVVQLLLQSPTLAPYQGDLATDFRSTLVSKNKLAVDESVIEVPYRAEGEDEPAARATTYKVRILYTKTVSIDELINYLNSTNLGHSLQDKHELTQVLNIFLNHYAKSADRLATIGSAKTFALNQNAVTGELGSGLDVIRGFFSSVRIATCRILVNINVSHGAFYHAGPLPALMNSYGVRNTAGLERFLRLVRVQTTHLQQKRNKANEVILRVKTIFGLARKDDGHQLAHPPRVQQHGSGAKEVQFWLDSPSGSSVTKTEAKGPKGKAKGKGKAPQDVSASSGSGRYVSVFDFFKTTHNMTLQHPGLPLVNCGNRENPMYLPAEVCVVFPGQSSKSKLDSNQTQQMIRHAVRKPWENATSITEHGIQTVGLDENSNALLRSFGLGITPGLIKVPGRILAGPKLIYKGSNTVDPRSGSWNMVNIKFNIGASLLKWSYLMVSYPGVRDSLNAQSLEAVMQVFLEALKKIGIKAAPPFTGQRYLKLQHADDPSIGATLQRAAGVLDLLFIILPEANSPLYKRIKSMADKDYGIHTICSVDSKLAKERGRDQYMNNVALKFNLKLGGMNQTVQNKSLGIVDQNKTMVVGIDVTHPSPGSSSNAPSVSAMVASVDKSLCQWPATLRVQRGRQENVDNLTEMLVSRLKLWQTKGKHASLPDNILVYRDGVSEGQYDMAVSQELPQLRLACQQLYPKADTQKGLPRFTIIICGKRHKTRFYPTAEQDCDRGNTKPGTVVDRGVTEARNWDFFLQAHAALQGTARPCHYYIVHDEIFRQVYAKSIPVPFQNIADIVEDLTHNMCYLFGRATKAVSLCPPAYYADLACERARCYLSSFFDSPSPSAAPSVAGTSAGGALPSPDDMQIHPKLRDTMFYI